MAREEYGMSVFLVSPALTAAARACLSYTRKYLVIYSNIQNFRHSVEECTMCLAWFNYNKFN